MRLLLASASPRRQELLQAAGFAFDVEAVDIDETRLHDEPPIAYVTRLAREKAQAGAARHGDRLVLGADTSVIIGNDVLGKPADPHDAARMLAMLSGRVHQVITGVALAWRGRVVSTVATTDVWVRALSAPEIDAYVATREPMDKAGAYAIQGRASRFIERIAGTYSNVVGLPIPDVVALMRELDIPEAE